MATAKGAMDVSMNTVNGVKDGAMGAMDAVNPLKATGEAPAAAPAAEAPVPAS